MTETHWDYARFAWEPVALTLHMSVVCLIIITFKYFNFFVEQAYYFIQY